jgi:hypothetical protein
MNKPLRCATLLLIIGFGSNFAPSRAAAAAPSPTNALAPSFAKWKNGPPADPNYFPIAVWLQSPHHAAQFKAAGINLYVGLWRGPTPNQLAELARAGMPVICDQNAVGLANKNNPIIAGWMHGDEPDNAQGLPGLRRYGPPILPERIVKEYEQIRTADPSRPVLLNLGQGVAWDQYIGRGVRRNHPEDYPEYLRGCDIASFDIYPVVHDASEVAGKLEFVAAGVDRLVRWTQGEKIVWNCIECTHISVPDRKANPDQIRAEVWMSLIHGSHGLIYFVHEFKPTFREAGLLEDPETLAAVTAINHQIKDLAPALNSPNLGGVSISAAADGPDASPTLKNDQAGKPPPFVSWMHKRHGDHNYLFGVNMRNTPVRVSVGIAGGSDATLEVLGESRSVTLHEGRFPEEFKAYAVHLYSW